MMNKRDSQLDILKGIGIILVVFAHTSETDVNSIIYLFHMPLFFFLSGAALDYSSNKDINLLKRFKHIMVPYFLFSMLCFLYWYFVEMRFRPIHESSQFSGWLGSLDYRWQQFINIITGFSVKSSFVYNAVLWFLPCLFVAMIIYQALRKWLGRYSVIGVVMLASTAFFFNNIRLPWCTEIAFVALPFIYGGKMLYGKIRIASPWIGTLFFLSIILILIFQPHVSMKRHVYGEWWLFYLVAFCIILSLCVFSRYLVNREKGILKWLGKNSLAIMCIHEPVKRILLVVVSKLSGMDVATLRESVIISISITILLMLLLVPVIIGINRYIPFILGKEKR